VSQSPVEGVSPKSIQQYEAAWGQLYEMLRSGKSLSGRERNCCFLNLEGTNKFADISVVSGLDVADDARAISVVDWDQDGDLDLWVTNRTSPRVRFFRNECPGENNFLRIRLQGVDCNRDAIGARLELQLGGDSPKRLLHTARAGDGFLSQSSKWIHFGLGSNDKIERLRVRWPGSTVAEEIKELEPNGHYRVMQGSGKATKLDIARPQVNLANMPIPVPARSPQQRAVIVGRLPLPMANYRDAIGIEHALTTDTDRPLLVTLWSRSCQPCLKELAAWSRDSQRFELAKLDVLAVNVDSLNSQAESSSSSEALLEQMGFAFRHGYASRSLIESMERFQGAFFDDIRPFPVPTSFLLDRHGRVVVVYRGPVDTDQILSDRKLVDEAPEVVRAAVTQFGGRWLMPPMRPNPLPLAGQLATSDPQQASEYLRKVLAIQESETGSRYRGTDEQMAQLNSALGALLLAQNDLRGSVEANQQAVQYDPSNRLAHSNLGTAFFRNRQWQAAISHFTYALDIMPHDVNLLVNRGLANQQLGEADQARDDYQAALQISANDLRARYNLARAEVSLGNDRAAIKQLEMLLKLRPDLVEGMHDLAWLLATSSDADVRQGGKAVRLAKELCRRTKFSNPKALHTLGAALAEVGKYAEAIGYAEKAIQLLSSQDKKLVSDLENCLKLYRQQQPFRAGK